MGKTYTHKYLYSFISSQLFRSSVFEINLLKSSNLALSNSVLHISMPGMLSPSKDFFFETRNHVNYYDKSHSTHSYYFCNPLVTLSGALSTPGSRARSTCRAPWWSSSPWSWAWSQGGRSSGYIGWCQAPAPGLQMFPRSADSQDTGRAARSWEWHVVTIYPLSIVCCTHFKSGANAHWERKQTQTICTLYKFKSWLFLRSIK